MGAGGERPGKGGRTTLRGLPCMGADGGTTLVSVFSPDEIAVAAPADGVDRPDCDHASADVPGKVACCALRLLLVCWPSCDADGSGALPPWSMKRMLLPPDRAVECAWHESVPLSVFVDMDRMFLSLMPLMGVGASGMSGRRIKLPNVGAGKKDEPATDPSA